MGKSVYISDKGRNFLVECLTMYKELHADSWEDGIYPEEEIEINKILEKLK